MKNTKMGTCFSCEICCKALPTGSFCCCGRICHLLRKTFCKKKESSLSIKKSSKNVQSSDYSTIKTTVQKQTISFDNGIKCGGGIRISSSLT